MSLAVTPCHSLSLLVIRCSPYCHSLSLVVLLVVTRCHSLYHSLSFVVTRCHSLSLLVQLFVTRCTTRLSFYKQSEKIILTLAITVNSITSTKMFYKKAVLKNFCNIHMKRPVFESYKNLCIKTFSQQVHN